MGQINRNDKITEILLCVTCIYFTWRKSETRTLYEAVSTGGTRANRGKAMWGAQTTATLAEGEGDCQWAEASRQASAVRGGIFLWRGHHTVLTVWKLHLAMSRRLSLKRHNNQSSNNDDNDKMPTTVSKRNKKESTSTEEQINTGPEEQRTHSLLLGCSYFVWLIQSMNKTRKMWSQWQVGYKC